MNLLRPIFSAIVIASCVINLTNARELEFVELKDGEKVVRGIVIATMRTLERMLEEDPIVFFHLVNHCRDRQYQLGDRLEKRLRETHLLDPSCRTFCVIIRNAVEGEELGLYLTNPIKQPVEKFSDLNNQQ